MLCNYCNKPRKKGYNWIWHQSEPHCKECIGRMTHAQQILFQFKIFNIEIRIARRFQDRTEYNKYWQKQNRPHLRAYARERYHKK